MENLCVQFSEYVPLFFHYSARIQRMLAAVEETDESVGERGCGKANGATYMYVGLFPRRAMHSWVGVHLPISVCPGEGRYADGSWPRLPPR